MPHVITDVAIAAQTEGAPPPDDAIAQAWMTHEKLLARWLRAEWVKHCRRPRSIITDPNQLTIKLRSALILSRPDFLALVRALNRGPVFTWPEVQKFGELVSRVVCKREEGGAPCLPR